jgi:hypothetical protein
LFSIFRYQQRMGQFQPGQAKPAGSGRKAGGPNRKTALARRIIAEADDAAICRKVIEDAKAAQPYALALYFKYLRPKGPCEAFALPKIESAADVLDTMRSIMACVAGGALSVDVGERAVAMLSSMLSVFQAVAMQEEIETLRGEIETLRETRPWPQ